MFGSVDLNMILAILPEIAILILAALVLAFDAIWQDDQKRSLGWLTAGGLVFTAILALTIGRPTAGGSLVWGGMLRYDWYALVFKILFLFGAAVTALFAMDFEGLGNRGEFYMLLLASTLGMNLMAASADMIMLYLSIETTSIPLYVLAGFFKKDAASTEAGFKYLLFGAMTSSIMLYGFSLLFGFAGTTSLTQLATGLAAGHLATLPIMGAFLLVLVGFGFKISVVPFHFWAPDVYQGAPTPVAGFLSTASKAAGFAVLMRFLLAMFPISSTLPLWMPIIAALSTITMTLGNMLALSQKNIKRLLAYSSIGHAGYMLVGVAAASKLGVASVTFYLITYLLTNLAAFAIVAAFWRITGDDDITAYAGMSRRAPGLALAMMVAFLSLAGVPPFAGFVGKVWLFAAAIDSGLVWLAVVGVLNSIIGIYYYLIVLKVVYLYRSEDEGKPLPITRPYMIGLSVLTVAIILVGTVFGPWFTWAQAAAAALF